MKGLPEKELSKLGFNVLKGIAQAVQSGEGHFRNSMCKRTYCGNSMVCWYNVLSFRT